MTRAHVSATGGLFLAGLLAVSAACEDRATNLRTRPSVRDTGPGSDAGPGDAVFADSGPSIDAGAPLDSGPVPDLGLPFDAGPTPDLGFERDATAPSDAGPAPDLGIWPDASAPDIGPIDAGQPSVPYASFCAEMASRMCTAAYQCCRAGERDVTHWGTDLASCNVQVAGGCEARLGPNSPTGALVQAGTTRYHESVALGCLQRLEDNAVSCASPVYRVLMDRCLDALEGTLASGTTCNAAITTPGVQCAHGYCPASSTGMAACVEFGNQGDRCGVSALCDFLGGLGCMIPAFTCGPQQPIGGACLTDDQCTSLNCGRSRRCVATGLCEVPTAL